MHGTGRFKDLMKYLGQNHSFLKYNWFRATGNQSQY